MIDLTGRTALVTGWGQGIGAGIAIALAQAGADVAVHYRASAPDDTLAAIEALGRRAVAVQGDLTVPAEADRVVAGAVAALGGLDILVNNAGHLVGRSAVATMTDEHWHAVIDVNVTSAFAVTRAATPHLTASHAGRVVMMSSLADENGGGV